MYKEFLNAAVLNSTAIMVSAPQSVSASDLDSQINDLEFETASLESLAKILVQRSIKDDNPLVFCANGTVVSTDYLQEQVKMLVHTQKRTSMEELISTLHVSRDILEPLVQTCAETNDWRILGSDIWTASHLQSEVQNLVQSVDTILLVAEAATRLSLPYTVVKEQMKEALLLSTDAGALAIVSPNYHHDILGKIIGMCQEATEPLSLSILISDCQWQSSWTLSVVQEALDASKMDGEIHGDTFTSQTCLNRQKTRILKTLGNHGVVSGNDVDKVSFSTIKKVVLDGNQDCVVLKRCVVSRKTIDVLSSTLDEANEDGGVLLLESFLPQALLDQEGDLRTLMMHNLSAIPGEYILANGSGLFFSSSFIAKAVTDTVKPMIQEMVEQNVEESDSVPDPPVVPLDLLCTSVRALMTDLGVVTDDVHSDLLSELCQLAFHTNDHEKACLKALQAALATKKARSSSSIQTGSLDTATMMRQFESPECFATACYQIQAAQKFMDYAVKNEIDDGHLTKLKEELLLLHCTDLTSRMTQFCLLKNNIEAKDLTFQSYEDGSLFCAPVHLGIPRQPKPISYLACSATNDKDETILPLDFLREALPGSVSVVLARLWTLCGSFQGSHKAGDLATFVHHVSEHSLTITGIPFKTLDKKAEKKFLFDRRQVLLHQLEDEEDAGRVLDLVIMLLYQLFRSLVVSSSNKDLLRGPILDMLLRERKMTVDNIAGLEDLRNALQQDADVNKDLVGCVRDMGLSKKRSKAVGLPKTTSWVMVGEE